MTPSARIAALISDVFVLPSMSPMPTCEQQYRCHLERNTTQVTARSWRFTGPVDSVVKMKSCSTLGRFMPSASHKLDLWRGAPEWQGVRDLQGLPGWTDCDQSTSIIGLTPTAARSSELPAIIGHADWSFGTASGLTRGESARLQTGAVIEEEWSVSHAPADGVRSVER